VATIYQLKPAFQNLLRPCCRWLANRGVTANQVTLAATALSVGTGLLLWRTAAAMPWTFALLPIVLFIRMGLNAIDGMLAREHNMKSDLGFLLNELGDVVSDIALILPFIAIAGIPNSLIVATALLAGMVEFVGVLGIAVGKERRYEGPMGKSDRAFMLGLLGTLLAVGLEPGLWSHALLGWMVLGSCLTVWKRGAAALVSADAANAAPAAPTAPAAPATLEVAHVRA